MSLDWLGWIAGGVLGAGGLYVLARALFADRSRGRRRCPRCWYDMDAVAGLVCPECGREVRDEAGLGRTRRHWRRAAAGVLLLLLGGLAAITPRLARDPWGTLPTPALSVILWFYDDPSDQLFLTLSRSAILGNATGFERLLLAKYCARKLLDPTLANPAPSAASAQAWSPMMADPRGQYYNVVARLGAEARPAIPALIQLSRSASGGNQAAITTLVRVWPGTAASRQRVIECLADASTQDVALLAIAGGPRPMPEVVTPILRSVQRGVGSTGVLGVRVLALLGPDGLPAVRQLVSHRDEGVRQAAIVPLGQQRDVGAVPALAAALSDTSWRVRNAAIVALHRIGPSASSALPELCRLAREEPRLTVRAAAAVALVPVGAADPRVVEALAGALGDEKPEIRRVAAKELGTLGLAAGAATAALERAAGDPDEGVADAAAAALVWIREK